MEPLSAIQLTPAVLATSQLDAAQLLSSPSAGLLAAQTIGGVPATTSGGPIGSALAGSGTPSSGAGGAGGVANLGTGTGSGSSTPAAGQTTGQLLQPGEFLTLLVDSLKYQDPLNPTTTSDFLSQLASLSQVQTQVQIAATDQIAAANALIGRTVSGSDLSGKPLSGVVDSVALASGSAVLEVGNDSMALSSVTSIGTPTPAAGSSTAASSTASSTAGSSTASSTAGSSTAGSSSSPPAPPAVGATPTG